MASISLDELEVGKHYLFEKNVDNLGMKYTLKWRVIILNKTKNDDGTYKLTIVGETKQEMTGRNSIWYRIGIMTFPRVNPGDYIIKEWTEKNKLFDSVNKILTKGKLTDDNLTEINHLLIGYHIGPIGGKSRRRLKKRKSNKRKSNKQR